MMHGQISGSKHDSDVVPFARAEKTRAPINSTKQARRSCNCSTERPALRMKTVGTRWRRRRGSRISCAQPKIGLQN
jgi:hypothetical protein